MCTLPLLSAKSCCWATVCPGSLVRCVCESHADVSVEPVQMLCWSALLGQGRCCQTPGLGSGFRLCLTPRLGARLEHSPSSQCSPRDFQNAAQVWPGPVISDRMDQFNSDTWWHFKTKQQDISQTASPGDPPAWPGLCYGPAGGHFDGDVAMVLLPAGSCGRQSSRAHPWCWGGASYAQGTACSSSLSFMSWNSLAQRPLLADGYSQLGLGFLVWFNPWHPLLCHRHPPQPTWDSAEIAQVTNSRNGFRQSLALKCGNSTMK